MTSLPDTTQPPAVRDFYRIFVALLNTSRDMFDHVNRPEPKGYDKGYVMDGIRLSAAWRDAINAAEAAIAAAKGAAQ